MAVYEALYRKWRPRTFDDIVAQPHITTTLRNQILRDKTAHAYLFTGSRGTGKTTSARIFAKAVNEQHDQKQRQPREHSRPPLTGGQVFHAL